MSRRKSSGVLDYLQSIEGLLEKGDALEIAEARQRYWAMKNKEYQARRRGRLCEVKITLTPEENKRMAREAKLRTMPLSTFLKQSGLAYVQQVYVAPDAVAVKRIEAHLSRVLTAIERIAARETKNWIMRDNDYSELRQSVREMKTQVHNELTNPTLLLATIAAHPERWNEIIALITDSKRRP
ncbi:MAG: hypothetical protein JWO03_3943 [Bacteroidetes bacterium]|nr:hypothetical protein [Bacteroidota bacterium]